MTTSISLDLKRYAGLLVAAAAAFFAILAPSAQAGALVETSPDCEYEDVSRVFLPWGDLARYGLAPDGGFEAGGEGWSLSGAASVVEGNSTHFANSENDTKSLSLPAGSSALSPAICVGLEHPTLRFFSKKVSGSNLLSAMTVSVRTETTLGVVLELPIGVVTPSGSWQPTLPMTVVANLLPLLPGEYAPVQFRFTPLLGGWRIDAVYVDPTRRS